MTYTGNAPLEVLSLGAGVQSTTLLIMAMNGEIKKPDEIIFADTGNEPKAVYEHLEYLKSICPFKIGVVQWDNIVNWHLNSKYFILPVFTSGGGQLRRQCTDHFKLKPIRRYLVQKYGRRFKANMMIGFSADEMNRRRISNKAWQTNIYPLIEKNMSREDCKNYLKEHGIQVPGKSSCVVCPFHSPKYWREFKAKYPDEYDEACKFDDKIRNLKFTKYNYYVCNIRRPLRDIDWGNPQLIMFEDMSQECTGICGT
uniref:Putative phosphoadenosine phosphosulfate n=1 Tax=viral metagenome TaxID=1070528 RepID=A0A6M3K387_9ZZZZ